MPTFVIPPSYQGRHSQMLKKRLEQRTLQSTASSQRRFQGTWSSAWPASSCSQFFCNLSGIPQSHNRIAIEVSDAKAKFGKGPNVFYDPGLSAGMTLKHIPYTTSPYGFPCPQQPASWVIDEAMFHGAQERLYDRERRYRSNAFNCGLTSNATRSSTSEQSKSVPGEVASRRSKLAALEIARHKLSLQVRQPSRSAPIVYSNLNDTGKNGIEAKNPSPDKIVFSCRAAEFEIQVKPHSVCLPSNPSLPSQVETRICVWLGGFEKGCFCKKQFTSWRTDIGDKTTVFDNNVMHFKLPKSRPPNHFIHFKVISRYNSVKGKLKHTVGKVAVPLASYEQPTERITRLLESTPKIPRVYASICFTPDKKRLMVTIGKLQGVPTGINHAKISVTAVLETMVDNKPLLTKRKTAPEKNISEMMEEVVVREAMSFDVEQPTWMMMRKLTTLTLTVRGHNLLVQTLKSHIGQIHLGLNAPVANAARYWDEITRNPGKTCTQWLELVIE